MESSIQKHGEANEQLGKIFELISANPCNNRCADCDQSNPEWTSQGFGTFICLNCAGYHRSIGAHVTTVRSLTLDEWSADQYAVLECGGNERFWEFVKNCHVLQRYHLPEVLYYTEVLKARIQNREPKEFNVDEWEGLVRPIDSDSVSSKPIASNSSGSASPTGGFTSSAKSIRANPVAWVDDSATKSCMLCNNSFTLMNRKHHCRRCGKVVCKDCAPADNTRPIIEWGMKDPVRHCKSCYRSPAVQWKS